MPVQEQQLLNNITGDNIVNFEERIDALTTALAKLNDNIAALSRQVASTPVEVPASKPPLTTLTEEAKYSPLEVLPKRGRPPKVVEEVIEKPKAEKAKARASYDDAAVALTAYIKSHTRAEALAFLRTYSPDVNTLRELSPLADKDPIFWSRFITDLATHAE